MFKNLKDKITTQVNKTNQTIFSTIRSTDSTTISNHENTRLRSDSSSSDVSQYISPSRLYLPPSDIESEHDDNDDDQQMSNKTKILIQTYKNKYIQLKKAYDEVEHEREQIKDLLQKYQDVSLQRKNELREQIKIKQQIELNYRTEIQIRDQQIEQLKNDHEENQKLHDKINKLVQNIDTHQEKQAELIIQNNHLQQQLIEKQTIIRELQQNFIKEKEEHTKLFDALKTDYENLTNDLQQTKQLQINNTIQLHDEKSSQLEQSQLEFISIEKQLRDENNFYRIQYDQINEQLYQTLATIEELQSDKSHLDLQLQTNESILKEQLKEIETLKNEIISLVNLNEENTRRIDEFENEKYNLQQEILENKGKLQQIQINDNLKHKDQIQIINDYEQRLKDKDHEYKIKLKSMAKEMSVQIDEKEQYYQKQLHDFIQNNCKTENNLINQSEQRIYNAEQRALIVEEHLSKLNEELKEKQLDHYRIVQELQYQIQTLIKAKVLMIEQFSQTNIDDIEIDHTHIVEPIEIDYLKEIILAYMTGTDRLTMVKVICAVLRYNEQQTLKIIEHEKFRQSRWLNSS